MWLYSEGVGVILPKDHPMADQPGGVPFDGGHVLFDWDLTKKPA
jgi:hypothetical protein